MNTFDNIVYSKLVESTATIGRDDLDPAVFQPRETGLPILRDSIKIQILKDIDEIRSVLPVAEFCIIGDILTRNYERSTPIDVSVQVDAQLVDSIAVADIMHLLNYINGRMAADTMHPLNYYIITHDMDDTQAEAVYDVVNELWVKSPRRHEPEVEKICAKFQEAMTTIDISSGELKRDMIDIDDLESLDEKNIKRLRVLMKQKLFQIESLLKNLVSTQHNPGKLKKLSFDMYNTPAELHLYGIMNQLPENVLYKLLEKYYYTKFIKKLENILDERGQLELTDSPSIKRIMRSIWKTS
ncbi:MAG: hypothetical protein WC905_04790 [Patescibacteria group bacterium]|jgi:hypothetical protein